MRRFTFGFVAGYLVGAVAGLKRIGLILRLVKLRKPAVAIAGIGNRVRGVLERGRWPDQRERAATGLAAAPDQRVRRTRLPSKEHHRTGSTRHGARQARGGRR